MVTHGNPCMSCPWDLKQEFGPLKDLEALENIMSFSSWGLLGTELIVTILKLSLHIAQRHIGHQTFWTIDTFTKLIS